jgi:hypothetical protein
MASPLDAKIWLVFHEEQRPAIVNHGYELAPEKTVYIINKPNGECKEKEKTVTCYSSKDAAKRPEEIRKEITKLLSKLQ